MKKQYIAIGFGVVLLIAFMIGITYVFLQSYTAKGRYMPAASKPTPSMDMSNHDMSGTQEVSTVVEDMRDKTKIDMDIINNSYQNPNIEITKGTTITWTNRDSIEHNVMEDHTNSGAKHDATTEDNVSEKKFSGPSKKKNESYSFTFNEPGQVEYHCAQHPEMRGKITVVGS